jgi:CRISPR-associated protein Csh2
MNRSELIFLYDIKDNNPNGDPLDSNKPRIDEETGINLVTDVRFKRTIRDYLHNYKEQEIFVREIADQDGNVQDGKTRALDFLNEEIEGDNKRKKIISDFKSGDLKIDKQEFLILKENISKNVIKDSIDTRLFGATIPVEVQKSRTKKGDKEISGSITYTGPVQFCMGKSLHKVSLRRIKGSGAFASGEDKANKTFREEYILPYSLIGFYGIINEHASVETNLSEEDIKLMLDAMWNGTKNLISRSKVGQVPRMLIRINYTEGSFHIGDLLKGIKLETELTDEEMIRGLEDFTLNIDMLIEALNLYKSRVKDIEYIVDEKVSFKLGGVNIKLENAIKNFNPKKLKIEG